MPNKLQAIQAKYTKCQKSSSFKLYSSKIHKMPKKFNLQAMQNRKQNTQNARSRNKLHVASAILGFFQYFLAA